MQDIWNFKISLIVAMLSMLDAYSCFSWFYKQANMVLVIWIY